MTTFKLLWQRQQHGPSWPVLTNYFACPRFANGAGKFKVACHDRLGPTAQSQEVGGAPLSITQQQQCVVRLSKNNYVFCSHRTVVWSLDNNGLTVTRICVKEVGLGCWFTRFYSLSFYLSHLGLCIRPLLNLKQITEKLIFMSLCWFFDSSSQYNAFELRKSKLLLKCSAKGDDKLSK